MALALLMRPFAAGCAFEDRLRDHGMHALGDVDDLRNVVVDRNTRDHIGLLARQLWEAPGDECDGLAHRDLYRLVEIFVQPHRDQLRRRFGARPGELHVLVQDELERPAQIRFDGSNIDIAISLRRVAVTGREQRARRMHRHIEDGTRSEIFIVEIAGMDGWRSAADPAHRGRRSNPHCAEEGMIYGDYDTFHDLGRLLHAAAPNPRQRTRSRAALRFPQRLLRRDFLDAFVFRHWGRHRLVRV